MTYSRLAIIGSSGGSALDKANRCLKRSGKEVDWLVITDRKCGLSDWAVENKYQHILINSSDMVSFSNSAESILDQHEINKVLLFFTKILNGSILSTKDISNIHPSLLPAFKGQGAVKQTIDYGSKYLGCTLHKVTEEVDAGPIIAQIISPLKEGIEYKDALKLSHFQKIWLALKWYEYTIDSEIPSNHLSLRINGFLPAPSEMRKDLMEQFVSILEDDNLEVIL